MAGKKVKKKNLKMQLLEHNNLLRLLASDNPPFYKEVAKANKLTVSSVNVMARRLKLAGRLNEYREVINNTPLTEEEFVKLPYPYPLDKANKIIKGEKKPVKKPVKKRKKVNGEVTTGLSNEVVFPESSPAGITITISPEALVAVAPALTKTLIEMLRTGGIK